MAKDPEQGSDDRLNPNRPNSERRDSGGQTLATRLGDASRHLGARWDLKRIGVVGVAVVVVLWAAHWFAASGTVYGARRLVGLRGAAVGIVALLIYNSAGPFLFRRHFPTAGDADNETPPDDSPRRADLASSVVEAPSPTSSEVLSVDAGPDLRTVASRSLDAGAGHQGDPGQLPRGREVLASGVALVALLGTLVGGLQAVDPIEPEEQRRARMPRSPGPRCPLRAETFERGANVRSGPGRNFEQIGRLGGNCSVGFAAYCIGLPANDLIFSDYLDARWYELPDGAGYVHAGSMQSLDADSKLPGHRRCVGGVIGPSTIELAVVPDQDVIHVTATAPHAFMVGFAIYGGSPSGFVDLGLTTAADPGGFTVDIGPRTEARLRDWPEKLPRRIVAAAACVALEVPATVPSSPSNKARTLSVTTAVELVMSPQGGVTAQEPSPRLSPAVLDRLGRTACLQPAPAPTSTNAAPATTTTIPASTSAPDPTATTSSTTTTAAVSPATSTP